MQEIKLNKVHLKNWYAQPIHCPFCGSSLDPEEEVGCKHHLFVISGGNFVSRSQRLDDLIGLSQEQSAVWPEFSKAEIARLGSPIDVSQKALGEISSSVQFEVEGPTDTTFIGFAPLENELCGWGVEHASPYDQNCKK